MPTTTAPRRSRRLRPLLVPVLLLAALVVAGCGDGDDDAGAATTTPAGGVEVVATTTIVGDLVRAVGGERLELQQLLTPGSDPHDYEPRPDDVVATADARLVIASGEGLDGWIEQVVEQSGGDAQLVELAEGLPVVREAGDDDHGHDEADGHEDDDHGHGEDDHGHEEDSGHGHEDDDHAHGEDDHGHEEDSANGEADGEAHDHAHGDVDPHWWHDPRNVEAAVLAIRDALSEADPEGADVYARNAEAYADRLRTLDADIEACVATIPRARRKLVTDHDAFGYFADRYQLEVVGTVIPSLTTQAQPSAGDLAELARTIEREGVPTVFTARSVSPKLAQALARETGARSDDTLYGDALGPDGSEGATYLAMAAHNADAIVRGLGGEGGCPDALATAR